MDSKELIKERLPMKLIDKDALVAEIKRLHNQEVQWMGRQGYTEYHLGLRDGYANILSFLNTLKMKEVDLEKAFNDEYSKFSNDVDAMDYSFPIDLADYKDFAKHFFEFGIKTQKGE